MRLAIFLVLLLSPLIASAQTVAPTLTPAFQWTEATGNPAGYEVYVKRSGSTAFIRENDVAGNWILLAPGPAGQVVEVYVRAFSTGKTFFGPNSPTSDPVVLASPLGTPGKPTWFELIVQWIRSLFRRNA